MHYYEVAPNQIIRSTSYFFTYASSSLLSIGQIVTVEVGKKHYIGVVIKKVAKPSYTTKQISSVIENTPIPEALVNTAIWTSTYYRTHLAIVLQTILPHGLHIKRREKIRTPYISHRKRTKNVFNPDQESAIEAISTMSPGSTVLHGITGSGKTRVYIELAKQTLAHGHSVVVLVPEIALTSQLLDEFSHHFDSVILTHSRQTEAERHRTWQEALYSTTPQIIIGPRSALFLPLRSVGLIVIDEAHEPSFKQEQSPRYSALRVASVLGKFHNARIVFGSATPTVTDYFLAKQSKRPIVHMTKRANSKTIPADIQLVDMTKKTNFKQHRFVSDTLISSVTKALDSGHQALIFHNRRGSASTTLCENCGWSALCPHCFIPFTLHADKHILRCHVCARTEKVPTHCPVCHSVDIVFKGIGTKLIESEFRKIFLNKKIVRFDGDNEPGDTVDQKYKELYDGTIDIIIGTQVIAKGLDLPKLHVVGVIQADAGLAMPDFSSAERTFQLLAQVVGRVGRSHHTTNVIVQSYQPTHPAVIDGIKQDYEHFYRTTIATRKAANFPPFCFLLKLTCIYKTEAAAIKNAQKLATILRAESPKTVEILGPTPAFYERQHNTYRWQLVVKSPSRAELTNLLHHLPPTHWQFELDPTTLL